MKTNRKEPHKITPVFEVGDIVSSLDKTQMRVIISFDKEDYEFINLIEWYFRDIVGNIHTIKKGSISKQPISVVHQHFSLLDLSK